MNPSAVNLISFNCNDAIGKYVLDVFNIVDKETYNDTDSAIKEIITNGYTDNFPSDITIAFNRKRI